MKVTPNGATLVLGYSDGSIGSYKISSTGTLTLISRELVTDGGIAGGPTAAPLPWLFQPLEQLVEGGGVVDRSESVQIACCGIVGELGSAV